MSETKHMHLFVADGWQDTVYRYVGSACDLDGIGTVLDTVEVTNVFDKSVICSEFDAKIMEAGEDGSLVTTHKLHREYDDDMICVRRSWEFQLRMRA